MPGDVALQALAIRLDGQPVESDEEETPPVAVLVLVVGALRDPCRGRTLMAASSAPPPVTTCADPICLPDVDRALSDEGRRASIPAFKPGHEGRFPEATGRGTRTASGIARSESISSDARRAADAEARPSCSSVSEVAVQASGSPAARYAAVTDAGTRPRSRTRCPLAFAQVRTEAASGAALLGRRADRVERLVFFGLGDVTRLWLLFLLAARCFAPCDPRSTSPSVASPNVTP